MNECAVSPMLRQRAPRQLLAALACAGLLFTVNPAFSQQQAQRPMHPPGQQQMHPRSAGVKGEAKDIIKNWPDVSKKAANSMIEKYGSPDEMTESMLIWRDNGPWKRTIVINNPIDHHFPMPHQDVLEQVIEYKVPPEKVGDLAKYDGSVIVERTRGEISARCDKEAANFLAINLAHEIVQGKRDVEGAREEYAKQIKAMMSNQPAPMTEGFTFKKPQGETAYADKPSDILQGMAMEPETADRPGRAGATVPPDRPNNRQIPERQQPAQGSEPKQHRDY